MTSIIQNHIRYAQTGKNNRKPKGYGTAPPSGHPVEPEDRCSTKAHKSTQKRNPAQTNGKETGTGTGQGQDRDTKIGHTKTPVRNPAENSKTPGNKAPGQRYRDKTRSSFLLFYNFILHINIRKKSASLSRTPDSPG